MTISIVNPYCIAKIERLAKSAGKTPEQYALDFLKARLSLALNRTQKGEPTLAARILQDALNVLFFLLLWVIPTHARKES